jgi:hypothetical protein
VFLTVWVYLALESIESDVDIDKTEIVKATSHLPKTVDGAYERILSRSHIRVAAERPLTLMEISVALALKENHRSYGDLDLRSEESTPPEGRSKSVFARTYEISVASS